MGGDNENIDPSINKPPDPKVPKTIEINIPSPNSSKDKPDNKNGDGGTDSKPGAEHTVSNPIITESNIDTPTQVRVEDVTEKNVENVSDGKEDDKDTLLAETDSTEVSSNVVEDTSSSPNDCSKEINSSSSTSNENRNKVSDDI